MSVRIQGRLLGGKKVELLHEPSGVRIVTDAPLDNHGEASSFSPTDLVAGALGACMMTVLAIVAERHHLDLSGMRMEAEKIMSAEPRRIGQVPITLHLPAGLGAADRARLEAAARVCPVHKSLHPDVQASVSFVYDVA